MRDCKSKNRTICIHSITGITIRSDKDIVIQADDKVQVEQGGDHGIKR